MTTGLIEQWAPAAAPPPAYTVSQWADAKRMLPQTSAARGSRWRTSATPYLRGVMDSVHEPGVTKIALMKSAQVGGSEAINNILGYFIEHDPCAILLVQPTDKVAEEFSKERLADMILSTPALASVVTSKRQTQESELGESTLTYKQFPGGYLVLGGANTPNTFARRSVRLAMGDDVDRFPAVVGEEGDPAELLTKRTETFTDGLTIFVSTPTLKGGRIDTLFQRGDQRRYFVTCPACGRADWITWSDAQHFRVGYDDRDPETARLECPSRDFGGCGAHLGEAARRQMVMAGEWRPTAASTEPGLISFHLPAMVTTLGKASLSAWVATWLTARTLGKESTRVFINTTLGEGWEDRGARMDPHALVNRREDYGPDVEVPAAAVAITAGVDVQDNRFEMSVFAWGASAERWLLDHRVIPGDPKQATTRALLLADLNRKYTHATGALLPIHATCIDSGYATEEVYDFVLSQQSIRRIFATKGFAERGGSPIVGKPSEKRSGRAGARPVRLYPVNVDDAKSDVYGALSVLDAGPGCLHFPLHLDSVDEEYFAQLCAEHKETRYNKLKVATHTVWVQDRERNEALDTAVLAYAAYKLLNPNIRQMLEQLHSASARTPVVNEPGQLPPVASAPAVPQRRVARSSYLQR